MCVYHMTFLIAYHSALLFNIFICEIFIILEKSDRFNYLVNTFVSYGNNPTITLSNLESEAHSEPSQVSNS